MASQLNYINAANSMRHELFELLDGLFFFLVNDYNEEILELMDSLISDINVSEEVGEAIFPQLVWWGIFCSPIGPGQHTIYQLYLQKNKLRFEKKSRAVQEVLESWLQLNPGFYDVDEFAGMEAGVYYLRDVFEGKLKRLSISNGLFQSPKSGDMLTGLILPMGDDSYTTLGGFYYISQPLAQKILNKIIPYFECHAVSPSYKFNPHLYPSLIKQTFEIIAERAGDPHDES